MACRCNCPDYRTHIRGINIGSFPTQTTYTERHWDKDMTAFKAMHDQGLSPARLQGAAAMERSAKNEREIKLGRPLDSATHALFDENGL
jgi:hypothetical protein